MVSKVKQCWTFEVLGPPMIYNRFNREISCHRITVSPNQSVICLVPCHQTSQSFALPPATKAVSHLTCPLPPRHCATASPCHRVGQSFALPPTTKPVSHLPCPLSQKQSVIWLALYHLITAPPHHRVSQSFALPPATKPVSHLTCPIPPCHHITT